MKMIMRQEDIQIVENRLKKFEENTGCDLLLIVAEKSDEYPAAPFRFALIASFLFNLVFSHYFEFQHAEMWSICFLVSFLFFTWIGHFSWAKRFALADWEITKETKEKAIELFHTFGTAKSGKNITAMIMVSILEHQIHVLVDQTLGQKISQAELDELVKIVEADFKKGEMTLGFLDSISSLEEKILKDFGGKVSDKHQNELQDTILFL